MPVNEYEQLRLRNIEDNKRILKELGILNPFKPLPRVIKNKRKRDPNYVPEQKRKKYIITTVSDSPAAVSLGTDEYGSVSDTGRRRSSRIKGLEAPEIKDIEDEVEKENTVTEEERARRKVLQERPMVYGPIPAVEVGTWWETRIACNAAGIHRPTVAGIHPGPEGAYSIALSGGYEDDIDMGDCFTYTGEGGRDLKGTVNKPKNLRTAPQSKDQCLSRGNTALVKSVETGFPVRVIRGYKSDSMFAPEEGYRYDGLYKVEKWWYTTGMAGFGVYKFAIKRIEDQAPPPWTLADTEIDTSEEKVVAVKSESLKDPLSSSQDSGIGSQKINKGVSDCESQDSGVDSQATDPETDDNGDQENPTSETSTKSESETSDKQEESVKTDEKSNRLENKMNEENSQTEQTENIMEVMKPEETPIKSGSETIDTDSECECDEEENQTETKSSEETEIKVKQTETETPNLETKPEKEPENQETKPEKETPNQETKPEKETSNQETKPEKETPNQETAPEKETPNQETKSEKDTPNQEMKPEKETPNQETKPEKKPHNQETKPEKETPNKELKPEKETKIKKNGKEKKNEKTKKKVVKPVTDSDNRDPESKENHSQVANKADPDQIDKNFKSPESNKKTKSAEETKPRARQESGKKKKRDSTGAADIRSFFSKKTV